jgi:hypothetical protein
VLQGPRSFLWRGSTGWCVKQMPASTTMGAIFNSLYSTAQINLWTGFIFTTPMSVGHCQIAWEISDIYSCCGEWFYSSPCVHKTFLRPHAVNISWVMGQLAEAYNLQQTPYEYTEKIWIQIIRLQIILHFCSNTKILLYTSTFQSMWHMSTFKINFSAQKFSSLNQNCHMLWN